MTVSVDCPGSLLGETWWLVITPSMMTSGVPLTVTIRITRSTGGIEPPASRKIVCSGERLLSVKVSWKPLRCPAATVTSTPVRQSRISLGTGTGTTGPAISVR